MLLVVVRFVARCDFLFPDSCHELSVNLDAAVDGRRGCLLLEGPAHVVEEACGGQHDRRWLQTTPMVWEELSVVVALGG